MELLKIKWWDHAAWSNGRWRDKQESIDSLTPVLVTTVGFLLKETDKYYVVCSTISDDDTTRHEFVILKGTVKKVKVLNG